MNFGTGFAAPSAQCQNLLPCGQINLKNMKKNLLVACFLFLATLMPLVAEAADFLLSSEVNNVETRDKVEIVASVGSKDQNINAIEGELLFSGNVKLLSINDGNSIISPWLIKPQETDGKIIFSGIIPNGYQGDGRILFKAIFEIVADGKIDFNLSGVVLKNDGLGTADKSNEGKLSLDSKKGNGGRVFAMNYQGDKEKPEKFSINLATDQNLNGGQPFIVFETQDKFSGIRKYEIGKAAPFLLFFKPSVPVVWSEVNSPVTISNNDLNNFVFIKATDGNQNERVEYLVPSAGIYQYRNLIIQSIIILFAVIILYLVRRRRK